MKSCSNLQTPLASTHAEVELPLQDLFFHFYLYPETRTDRHVNALHSVSIVQHVQNNMEQGT